MGCNVSWESWFIKTSYCCEGRSWLTYLINYNTVSRTAPARPSHLVRVLEKYTTYNISVPTPPQLLAWVDLPCQIDLCIKNIYIYMKKGYSFMHPRFIGCICWWSLVEPKNTEKNFLPSSSTKFRHNLFSINISKSYHNLTNCPPGPCDINTGHFYTFYCS